MIKVAAKVSEGPQAPHPAWSEGRDRRYTTSSSADRLAAVWLLSPQSLRRGEVCGLRWSDVSLTEGMISIRPTRVTVNGSVHEKGPKSSRGYRVLPLFQPVLGSLEALYAPARRSAGDRACLPRNRRRGVRGRRRTRARPP